MTRHMKLTYRIMRRIVSPQPTTFKRAMLMCLLINLNRTYHKMFWKRRTNLSLQSFDVTCINLCIKLFISCFSMVLLSNFSCNSNYSRDISGDSRFLRIVSRIVPKVSIKRFLSTVFPIRQSVITPISKLCSLKY